MRTRRIWKKCVGLPNFQTAAIINERSALADHTAYWDNADGFIARVVERVSAWANLGWLSRSRTISATEILRMQRVRSVRIWLRQAAHFLLAGFAIAFAVQLWDIWTPLATRLDQMPAVRSVFSGFNILPFAEPTLQWLRLSALGVGAHILGLSLYLRFVSGPLWRWWATCFNGVAQGQV